MDKPRPNVQHDDYGSDYCIDYWKYAKRVDFRYSHYIYNGNSVR